MVQCGCGGVCQKWMCGAKGQRSWWLWGVAYLLIYIERKRGREREERDVTVKVLAYLSFRRWRTYEELRKQSISIVQAIHHIS